MSDTYTEITSANYFKRLAGSFVAAAFGVLLFLVAIGVLVWNESRAVDALRGLGQAAKDVIEATPTPIEAAQNGKLVHIAGTLATHAPLSDAPLGLTIPGLIHLKRTVEMYQWKESEESHSNSSIGGSETTTKTYTYTRKWSEDPIDSSRFRQQTRHENPAMPLRTMVVTAQDATIGDRKLEPTLLDDMDSYEPTQPPAVAPDGYRALGDLLYKGGSPDSPRVGDIRIAFSSVPVQPVSVMAEQRGDSLTPFRTSSGYKIGLMAAGDKSADEMIAQKRAQEKTLTWILRAVGFAIFFFSLLLMSAPLSALGNVIPFVASIIGGSIFVFALGLAIPLTLVTIALSWLAFRPFFGAGLLIVAVLCVFGYRRLRPTRPPVAPPSGIQGGAPA